MLFERRSGLLKVSPGFSITVGHSYLHVSRFLLCEVGALQCWSLHIRCVKPIISEPTFAHLHTCSWTELYIYKSFDYKHVIPSCQYTLNIRIIRMLSVTVSIFLYYIPIIFFCCGSDQISFQISKEVCPLYSHLTSAEYQSNDWILKDGAFWCSPWPQIYQVCDL